MFSVLLLSVGVYSMKDWYTSKNISDTEEKELESFVKIENVAEEDVAVVPDDVEVLLVKEKEPIEVEKVSRFNEVIDFNSLSGINKDTVGWIRNEDGVNNPVVLSKDGQEYLNTSFYGKKSSAGTVFTLDKTDLTDDNISLYGHTMGRNRTDFFASLHKYKDLNYAKNFSDFEFIDDNGEKSTYKFIAIFEMDIANDDFNPFVSNFHNDSSKRNHYNQIVDKSLFSMDHNFNEDDKYLTLMTCLKGGRDITDRVIVVGVKQ